MKFRLTDLRKEILNVINKAKKPLNAKIIKKRLISQPDFSTIYRALDFLERQKFVYSVSFTGVKYYFTSKKGNGHFLVCKKCREILEFKDCVAESLQERIQQKYNYKISEHVLYFEGLCSKCQNYLNKKSKVMS